MWVISRSRLVVLSCRFRPFSISEVAESQHAKEEQVKQLKVEICSARADFSRLRNPHMSREELLTFDMLERHPLVTDQIEYEFQWEKVDALYQFVDRLPTWVVDDEIIKIWKTGHEDVPQSFCSWEAEKAVWGQVLMLSWSPAQIGGSAASTTVKVFTAVVFCIHPCQAVMSIKDGANDLINHSIAEPKKSMSALCQLPKHSAKTFYPSPLNDTFLVLP